MAVITPIASGNVDDLTWRANDSLTINNGYTITVNTDQTKFWSGITINNGKLRIENTSTSTAIRFVLGRVSGTTSPAITPASGLGSIEIAGNWIEIGTGDDTVNQTFTVPYTDHVAAIWVETANGSGIYKPWANCFYRFPHQGGEFELEGFDGYGSGVKGNVFYQIPEPSPMYHTVQTNCTTSTASRILTMSSTTGIKPGAFIVGSVGITANTVVERVIDGTTLEMNVVGSANSAVATITIYNSNPCWLTNQIKVGDGVHGNKIPTGCKVRIPNILITAVYGINIGSSTGGVNINLTNGGSLIADKCLFSQSHNTFTTPQTLSLQNCGFSYPHSITKAYGVVMNSVCFSVWPQMPYLTSNRFQYGLAYGSTANTSVHTFTYITGTFTELVFYGPLNYGANAHTTGGGYLGFSYADGIVVDDVTIVLARTFAVNASAAAICLQYVYRSSFSNLQVHGHAPLHLYASSNNTIEGINWSPVARSDYAIPNYATNQGNFLGFDPATGADFVDGTNYFVKQQIKQILLKSHPWSSGRELTIAAMHSSNLGFFNDVSFVPGNAVVTAYWDDRRPTHTSPAFEIYKSTTAGVPVRDAGTKVFNTNSVTTLTYADGAVVNGTRYYYVLRKYYSAGVYEDSPVWDVTPAANVVFQNYAQYSFNLNNASWVKTNATVPTNSDSPGPVYTQALYTGATVRRVQVTGASATVYQDILSMTPGQTYTASVWTYFSGSANNAVAAVVSTPMRLTFGTAFVDFTATQAWTRTSVTFTATTTSHRVTLRFDTSGNWVDVGNICVAPGASASFDVVTTTTGITNPTWDLNFARAYAYPWATDHNAGGLVTPPTSTLGGQSLVRVNLSTTRNFTPSELNEVILNDSAHVAITVSTTSSNNVFRNFTQQGKGAYLNQFIFAQVSSSDNLFENFTIDRGFSGFRGATAANIVNLNTDSNRNIFRNFAVANHINSQTATRPFFTDNAVNDTVIENFRVEPTNTYLNTLNNGMILKGCGGANGYNADAATTFTITSTTDGVDTTFTGVYDTHFAEVYHSATTGALHLFFTASTSASPPVVLTGTALFSNTGLLYLQAPGDSATYTWPHKIYGVSGFRNTPHLVVQTDLGMSTDKLECLLLEFQIDTGGGYTAWAEATPAALSALDVSASAGFYLKLRLTARQFFKYTSQANNFVIGETIRQLTSGATARVVADYDLGTQGTLVVDNVVGTFTANTVLDIVRDSDSQIRCTDTSLTNGFLLGPSFTSRINAFRIHTTVDQTVMYPTNPITITFTGLPSGYDAVVLEAGTSNILSQVDNVASTTFSYVYYVVDTVDVGFIKAGYVPFYIRNLVLSAADASIPVSLSIDRNYS